MRGSACSFFAGGAPARGSETVERILRKTKAIQEFSVVNFNSTFYGGGVAELLSGITLLMNSAGIKAEWRVIQGRPDFFNVTKKMHNALQGADINLSEIKTNIFEEVNFENALLAAAIVGPIERRHLYRGGKNRRSSICFPPRSRPRSATAA